MWFNIAIDIFNAEIRTRSVLQAPLSCKVYVCGGEDEDGELLSSTVRFDPGRGAWEDLPNERQESLQQIADFYFNLERELISIASSRIFRRLAAASSMAPRNELKSPRVHECTSYAQSVDPAPQTSPKSSAAWFTGSKMGT